MRPSRALARFDALPTVAPDLMTGTWTGEVLGTGHPLDVLLPVFRWYGKRFEPGGAAHPLLFTSARGGVVSVDPRVFRAALPLIRSGRVGTLLAGGALTGRGFPLMTRLLGGAFTRLVPLLATRRAHAELRVVEHRGQRTAAMVYGRLPITDVFRKVDPDTVMAVMEMRGMESPFFFTLRRRPVPGG